MIVLVTIYAQIYNPTSWNVLGELYWVNSNESKEILLGNTSVVIQKSVPNERKELSHGFTRDN